MKILLIPFLLLAATMTANAHCGACGAVDKAHAGPAAAKSECSDKAKADCAEKKADCTEKKDCDTGSVKSACAADKAPAQAKAKVPMPKMGCCPAEG